MKYPFKNFCRISGVLTTILWATGAYCAGAANPRAVATDSGARTSRTASRVVTRGTGDSVRDSSVSTARTAVGQKKVVTGRGASGASRAAKVGLTSRNAVSAPRAAMTAISRTAVRPFGGATNARSAKRVSDTGLSRAASTARATAVFNDISKIGGGYAACRESYATCMDQFCANANDTFRRCYCSERFTDFRDTEEALDQAKTLLQQFEDNNLNAVDKTASEVNAMYSATAGEAAIKTDVSGAQSLLNSIGDLLSGKKKKIDTPSSSSTSLGIMSLDFSTSVDDIWGGGAFEDDSFFADNSTAVDMTALEGKALFDTSNKQCVQVISSACENQAMLNMATSAYGIMIAQDCNMYEKNVNKKREQVKQAVRQAEKVLRDARLEEYRAHNSADVNECLSRVRNAIKTDVACGPNYERCLDYTGAYVNISTGEPIYSARLFQLENLIKLDGVDKDGNVNGDVLSQNTGFDAFLDERKMFANSALDSCRDIADTVWTEFKRSALIEIAQAQDEKLEEVRMSCVSTMAECYDTQTGALKSFDTTNSQVTGAISAYAAKSMCQEKVTACAMLYAPNDATCSFDANGHITDGDKCGLTALLNFVDTVDDVRVAEGCADGVQKYVNDLCAPVDGESMPHPWGCRQLLGAPAGTGNNSGTSNLQISVPMAEVQSSAPQKMEQGLSAKAAVTPLRARAATTVTTYGSVQSVNANFTKMVQDYAVQICADPTKKSKTYNSLDETTKRMVDGIINDTVAQLSILLETECEKLDGYWYPETPPAGSSLLAAFYSSVYGRRDDSAYDTTNGACVENTVKVRCEAYNSSSDTKVAEYIAERDECVFTDDWYKQQCEFIGGYFEDSICYIKEN